jgi:G6PDH family F420-dependent oxidoreductase
MVAFGYTLMTEQRGPRELVSDAVAAEQAGFDFEVSSDHYFPWLDSQGHAPNAWPVLGAVATATQRVPLMTYVTCPIMRYHPAVVAQKAATVALLAGDDRFVLGLGAGENLNEHVVGRGWPPANVRHEMFAEAIEIISRLFGGGYVTMNGQHFRVDSARLWDLPSARVPIAVAVSGSQSVEVFAPVADAMVAVEPDAELVTGFDAAAGASLPKIGQQPICWDPDKDAAVARAHDQFRWFAGGWKVNAELPGTAGFAAATQFVRPDDVAEAITCGPDVAAHVEAVRPFVDAGFTHVALVQIGGQSQPEFLSFASRELLPALREEYGKADDPVVRRRRS